jgi:hypothetical protein
MTEEYVPACTMPGIRPARAKKRFDQARVASFMSQ